MNNYKNITGLSFVLFRIWSVVARTFCRIIHINILPEIQSLRGRIEKAPVADPEGFLGGGGGGEFKLRGTKRTPSPPHVLNIL